MTVAGEEETAISRGNQEILAGGPRLTITMVCNKFAFVLQWTVVNGMC